MKMIIIMFLTSLLACEKPETIPPDPPVEEDEVFELIWATRMDFEKEIVGTDNTQHYKDWMLVGGDLNFPPTVMAFNKLTGNKDWEYIHNGVINDELDVSEVVGNIYIGLCSKGIIAIDLDNRQAIWEIDLAGMNMRRGYKIMCRGNKIYTKVSWACDTPSCIRHIMEIDILTGEYNSVYSSTDDISPLVFWEDTIIGKTVMLFNCYPNNFDPPEKTTQGIMAFDLESKDTIWKISEFTENFSTNVLHPPIIHNGIVITGGDWSIYAFDVRTGEQLWRYEFDYPWAIWTKTNHLLHDGRLYVNNSQEDVTCLNPETGELIWNNPKGGANCTDNMVYYEKEDLLVFTSWGYGSVMVLDALTGETLHEEHRYDDSSYNNDVVYDAETDMFFTSTYKHAVGFKIHRPK